LHAEIVHPLAVTARIREGVEIARALVEVGGAVDEAELRAGEVARPARVRSNMGATAQMLGFRSASAVADGASGKRCSRDRSSAAWKGPLISSHGRTSSTSSQVVRGSAVWKRRT